MANNRDVLLALGYYDHRFHLGVARYAQAHGWHLSAGLAYDRRIPDGWSGDGIIAKLTESGPLSRFVTRTRVPVVNVGRGVGRPMPLVLIDEERVAKLAAEHFLGRGFEHFAWVGPRPGRIDKVPRGMQRLERAGLFQQELRQAGRTCAILDWQQEVGERPDRWSAQQAWYGARLKELPKPLAVFCWDDSTAADVIVACRVAGLSIPEQVAVLGVNNDELVCDALPVPLSSIDTDMEGRAFQAAALLDQMMDGKEVPSHTLIAPKGLITRASSDILAIAHDATATALRFIWDNLHRPISVAQVADVAAISARGLHKAFVLRLHRTPIQEIIRARVQRAQELLRNTDDKITTIARRAGFSSGRNLFRVFRQHQNETPHAYRARHRQLR